MRKVVFVLFAVCMDCYFLFLASISAFNLKQAILKSMEFIFGDISAGLDMNVLSVNSENNTAIVQCDKDFQAVVWGGISFITRLKEREKKKKQLFKFYSTVSEGRLARCL